MSSPRGVSGPGQKVFRTGLRLFGPILNTSFTSVNVFKCVFLGGSGREKKSCNVVPMQLLTSRVQPGFWSAS